MQIKLFMNNLLVSKDKSLKSTILQLEKNANGLVFIVEKNNKLVGVFSDGDLRRLLLKKNVSLNTKISRVINLFMHIVHGIKKKLLLLLINMEKKLKYYHFYQSKKLFKILYLKIGCVIYLFFHHH